MSSKVCVRQGEQKQLVFLTYNSWKDCLQSGHCSKRLHICGPWTRTACTGSLADANDDFGTLQDPFRRAEYRTEFDYCRFQQITPKRPDIT